MLTPKIVFSNFRVEVYPRARWFGTHTAEEERRVCEDIVRAINRHVDDVGTVQLTFDQSKVCPHCGEDWKPDPEDGNGCRNAHIAEWEGQRWLVNRP